MEAKKIPEPEGQEKEEEKKAKEVTAQPQPTASDVYWAFVKASPMVSANDVAAFKQEDGIIAVFVDPLGRSVLTTSVYIPYKVLETLQKLAKKS